MKKVRILICLVLMLAVVVQTSCSGAPADNVSLPESEADTIPASAATASAAESEEDEVSEESAPAAEVVKTLTADEIKDRIEGSWAAQMIGVAWGASTEFQYQGGIIPENKVPVWNAQMINDAFGQDDLYVEIPFLDAMEKNGATCGLSVLADAFRDTQFGLDHANLQGRSNLRAGIPAPLSGSYIYNYHCDDIDWQIEADFLGNLYPGLAEKAAERAFEIGHIMNYGDGVYGGVYIAVMHAAAFSAESVYEIAEAGRKAIPEGTKFRKVLDEVDECYNNGMTWEQCWQKIQNDWGTGARCVRWLGMAANIDAKLNAAYVHMGLLWGNGDFAETVKISMRCGQDSDCNPSSAAGVLGTFYGLSGLGEEYVSALDRTALFSCTDYSFTKCIETSYELAERIMRENGSIGDDGAWLIRACGAGSFAAEGPVPFEQWPSDALNAYLTVTAGARGNVRIESAYSLPEGYSGEVTHSLDMGDGTVLPFIFDKYEYAQDGTYDIVYTVKAGDLESTAAVTVSVAGAGYGDRGFISTPSCSTQYPAGSGSRDIAVITDGVLPGSASPSSAEQYDTYTGGHSTSEWFALTFDHSVHVTGVSFTEGMHFGNGGWFDPAPSVQILKDGEWTDAPAACDPAYGGHAALTTFTFALEKAEWCEGVRVIGKPGGSATFVSCAELDVAFDEVKDPTHVAKDPVQGALIMISVAEPRGTGCKDIEIIRDGYIPKPGDNYVKVSYDTFAYNAADHEEYVGYVFRGTHTVASVTFTEGANFNDGGFFKDGSIRIEALVDGAWQTVETTPDKPYPVGNTQSMFLPNYESYKFTLTTPVNCGGVRVVGAAGGSMHFISVSELSVEFSGE